MTPPRDAVTVIYKRPEDAGSAWALPEPVEPPASDAQLPKARTPPEELSARTSADVKPAAIQPLDKIGVDKSAEADGSKARDVPPPKTRPPASPKPQLVLDHRTRGWLTDKKGLSARSPPPAKPAAVALSKSIETTASTRPAVNGLRAAIVQNEDNLAPAKEPAPKAQTETEGQRPGEVFSDCTDCPKLVVVQPRQGPALVSLDPNGAAAPLKPFAIGVYEVTFAEWDRCVAAGGCRERPDDGGWGRGNRPVINVSFDEIAGEYLPWLARATGRAYRLPSEDEWQLAARGRASRDGDGSASDKDPTSCELGNFADGVGDAACGDGFAGTAPVGSFKANSLGIFDLQGNVWEWTADCVRVGFSQDTAKNPVDCNQRVLRGGSWASEADSVRAGNRGWEKPEKKKNSVGFRLVRSLD